MLLVVMHMTQVSVNRHRGMRTFDMTSRMWIEHRLAGLTYCYLTIPMYGYRILTLSLIICRLFYDK